MTLKDEFKSAAVEIFDEFISLNIAAIYLERNSAYIAGGSNNVDDTPHDIRLIRETKSELAIAIAGDVNSTEELYLMIIDELPIEAKAKDYIKIGSKQFVIQEVIPDGADAVATLRVDKS